MTTPSPRRTNDTVARVSISQIEACICQLVKERAPSSICPSDVARALSPREFRTLMPRVRSAAGRLAKRGKVIVTQRGREVDVAVARGPIRIVATPSSEGARTRDGR